MFLVNSRLGPLSATPSCSTGTRTRGFTLPGCPFSRSYGASLPSSLAWVLSSTLVCSTSPPVSVCGTGATSLASGFSWPYRINPFGFSRNLPLPLASRSTPPRICQWELPTGLEGAVSPRPPPDLPPGVPASLPGLRHTERGGTGISTSCPSAAAYACALGPPHPQLISIAAEPLGIRWEGFAPSSRYSCRHSHSAPLQVTFQFPFSADADAPLPRAFLTHIRSVGG